MGPDQLLMWRLEAMTPWERLGELEQALDTLLAYAADNPERRKAIDELMATLVERILKAAGEVEVLSFLSEDWDGNKPPTHKLDEGDEAEAAAERAYRQVAEKAMQCFEKIAVLKSSELQRTRKFLLLEIALRIRDTEDEAEADTLWKFFSSSSTLCFSDDGILANDILGTMSKTYCRASRLLRHLASITDDTKNMYDEGRVGGLVHGLCRARARWEGPYHLQREAWILQEVRGCSLWALQSLKKAADRIIALDQAVNVLSKDLLGITRRKYTATSTIILSVSQPATDVTRAQEHLPALVKTVRAWQKKYPHKVILHYVWRPSEPWLREIIRPRS